MDWPTITKDTPIEKVFEIHRMIWDDVLDRFERTGELRKPNTPYFCDCVFCECRSIVSTKCAKCLADWRPMIDGPLYSCMNSYIYNMYLYHQDHCKRTWLYRQSFRDEIVETIKAVRNIPRKKN